MYNDLYPSMKTLERALIDCLKAENLYIPAGWETAHNIGRWWEAALLMQSAVSMEIPSDMDLAMTMHLRALSANPLGMLINDPELVSVSKLCEREIAKSRVEDYAVLDGARSNYHNLREAMLAYASLARFRDSHYAVMAAEKLLDTIGRRFFDGTLTDREICETIGLPPPEEPAVPRKYIDDTGSSGRAIEGMFRYWKVTGSPRALEVMQKAVAFHRVHTIHADGSIPHWVSDPDHIGHNHSYLGTLRGLLLYAIQFEDKALIDAVYLAYKNVIPKYSCDEHGFAPHDLGCLRFPDRNGDPLGDHASCADTAYIAFLLAVRCGHTALLADAERLVRRLFYVQREDDGAWGIFDGYFSHGYTIDVFTAIAATFCYMMEDMLEERADGIYVHLHFSHSIPAAEVRSARDDRQNTTITLQQKKRLCVHIPAWCSGDMVSVTDADGMAVPYTMEEEYLVIGENDVTPKQSVHVSYALPIHESTAHTWVSGQSFRVLWKGDSIIQTEKR